MHFLNNPWAGRGLPEDTGVAPGELSMDTQGAHDLFWSCFNGGATPLVAAPQLADIFGVGSIAIKDERHRLGLGSFKALGAAYAIAKRASARMAQSDSEDLGTALSGTTFVCASAGNHGLSLAAGAARFGATAAVFVSETVPEAFAARLTRLGAKVIRAGQTYEASMAEAERQASGNGWVLLPDSTWPGMTDAGRDVMEGYLIMGAEVAAQIPAPPTHIFLQAGVGGLAAACAASARLAWGSAPKILVVEPQAAPALWASIKAGKPAVGEGPVSSMGRLDCKEPSHLALKYLAAEADGFLLISEEEAAETVTLLSRQDLASTPSGAAGIAAVHHAGSLAPNLGLGPSSRVLCYLSEGPEDA